METELENGMNHLHNLLWGAESTARYNSNSEDSGPGESTDDKKSTTSGGSHSINPGSISSGFYKRIGNALLEGIVIGVDEGASMVSDLSTVGAIGCFITSFFSLRLLLGCLYA
ncbi:MAG: hypothetical protein LWX56_11170 [Ignavibacteria bacterium]|nr:hypothetical protein [Ignavibacteria bacterium]